MAGPEKEGAANDQLATPNTNALLPGWSTETNTAAGTRHQPVLWPFQREVLAKIADAVRSGQRRILVVSPTGSGKTVQAAALTADAVKAGKRVLYFDHRIELTEQAAAKLFAVGIDAGIIQAGFKPRPCERVQLASVQSFHARIVRAGNEAPEADLIVVDEAHHVEATTYQRILQLYPNAVVIGFTATPCRGDGRGLGNTFETIVEAPQVADLIAGGFLVPARIFAPYRPDLQGVRIARGDYAENHLAERMDKPELVGDVVEHWLRIAERRGTVVFATSVAHSVHLRDEFLRAGVMAAHVDGTTPADERKGILKGLASGTVEIVTNCAVLTEGFDAPAIGALILARPTKSIGLYRQMVGRVLRASPGKSDAIILDHAGAVYEHGLPDDPIVWTLDEDRRAVNTAHAARGKIAGMPKLCTCPECDGVRFEGKPCTVCGWRPRPKPKDFETADGDLGEVQRDRSVKAAIIERARFHGMLAWIAREKGYKSGWAAHKFKEKFGTWPNDRYVLPIPPDDACRAWVRSRQIAWAKAQQKAGAA